MDNRKDCRWVEILRNAYGDRIENVFCHLKPESKKVDLEKDCANCPHYAIEREGCEN